MRTDTTSPGTANLRARGWIRVTEALQPSAVDAALADESMLMTGQRGSRRDRASRLAPTMRSRAPEASDAPALLESLADQIDLLYEQQRQIQRLLDRTDHVRIDGGV